MHYLVIMPGNSLPGNNRKFFDEISRVSGILQYPVTLSIKTNLAFFQLISCSIALLLHC